MSLFKTFLCKASKGYTLILKDKIYNIVQFELRDRAT